MVEQEDKRLVKVFYGLDLAAAELRITTEDPSRAGIPAGNITFGDIADKIEQEKTELLLKCRRNAGCYLFNAGLCGGFRFSRDRKALRAGGDVGSLTDEELTEMMKNKALCKPQENLDQWLHRKLGKLAVEYDQTLLAVEKLDSEFE